MRIQGSARGRQSAIKSRLLCGSALASFAIISLATASSAFGQDTGSPSSPGNTIVPDGRTATSLSVQGTVTDITTGTLAGGNAYNSFSTFGAAEGNTVNLHVPTGAGYLVNIVRNAPVDIQGTVNSYQNGTIGGNIVFADPYGLVVGKTGTINTGGLTVVTPTSATLDNVLNKAGQVDQGLAAQMNEGNVPLSPDGSVVIAGKVNAESYVKITAHDITVAGSEQEARKAARQKAQFHATVNSSRMTEGGAIVVRNGSIRLVAAGDVNVAGKVHAKGSSGAVSIRAQGSVNIEKTARIKAGSKANQIAAATQTAPAVSIEAGKNARIDGRLAVQAAQSANAGQITVRAGNTLVGSTASFVAKGSGTANGGTISIKSDIDTTVASGASFTASALGSGNGGFVEISAVHTDTIAAGVEFDLGSKSGASGTILFDPADLVIGGTSGSASIYSNGTNISLDATNSITIYGVIDTRAYSGNHITGLLSTSNVVSTGNSGKVTLTAPTITINGSGAIYADVYNSSSTSYTAGDVKLEATSADMQAWAPSSATTGITIAGTITGADITATATSTAIVSLTASATNMASTVTRTVAGLLAGINGGYLGASATANVSVLSGASIRGSGAVTLSASGSETASDVNIVPATGTYQRAIGAAVVVGETNASVSTNIASGATIYSGGKLTVSAVNSASLSVNAQVYSTNTAADSAFAYSTGTIQTNASIDSGATISNAGSVAVAAQNTNSFSTVASANAMGKGNAGVAVAISNINTSATANLGTSVNTPGNVDVYSGSNTTANVVRASTTVGDDFAGATFSTLVSESSFLTDVFGPGGYYHSGNGAAEAAVEGNTFETSKGGITLGLNLGSQSSQASITAANVTATGSVGVVSLLTDTGIRSNASSQINSSSDPSPFNPAASTAVSMAVAVAQITHNSNAFIGSGSHVSAHQIVVDAQTEVPILNSWMQWSDFSSVVSHLSANAGIVNDILTSYANATATATDGGISGALNYFKITNNTSAWVASNAVLTQTGAANPASTYSISGDDFDTSFQTIDITGNIEVKALTETQSINVGGNFSWLGLAGTNGGSSDATAVGGSANVNIFHSNTIAGIGAGASVAAQGILDVSAKTADTVFAVSPTSGKGSGLGLNGIASVLMIDNNTSASISNLATIRAPIVSISAEQQLSSFDIAGAVGGSTSSGVGLSVALVDLETATTAFIGNNGQELARSGASSDDTGTVTAISGSVAADKLAVTALTTGRLQTLSVAAQYANDAAPPTASEALQRTAPSDADYLTQLGYFVGNGFAALAAKIDDAVNGLNGNMNMVNGTSSMAGAGSSSISLTSLATTASVTDAHLAAFTGGYDNAVTVQALNNTILTTASGAAAIAIGAPGTNRAAAIAGTLALDTSADLTSATIRRSQVTATNIAVQALAGGENTVVGLAVALTSGSASSATNASISGSVLINRNGVQALVDSSSLGGATASANGTISIAADQKTRIGIGGGALSLGLTGGGTGLGIALTYADIGDPSSGDAVSAILSGSTVVNTARLSVLALDQSRILSGAAVATGGAGTYGFAGSVIVNTINPTISAKILNGSVATSGDVVVSSSGGSDSALDAMISNARIAATGGLAISGGGTGSGNANFDFSASAVSPTSASGAAIIAVAGQVAFGKSNVGLSLVVNRIAQINQATVDGVTLTSEGAVTVTSTNDAEILGVAVGANFAAGSVAGLGSVVYNSIADGVVAQVGGGSNATSVTAKSVSVIAEDGAHIRGATGALAANLNSSAVGLSVTVNQIANYVAATVSKASVTVNLPATASAMGGSLLISGQSNAAITTASVTGSFSGGASATTPSAGGGSSSSPLSTLFTKFVPASLARLQAASSPPQQQSAPSTPGTSSLTGAGSISLSTEATSVYASIVSNATVAAQNNVILLADNSDAITVYAGALALSAGTGTTASASVLVNEISGTTSAYVSGSRVDAFGRSTGYAVDSGQLLTSVDPSALVSPNALPALQNGTVTVNGIAVVATSLQTVKTVSAVAAGSTSGTTLAANAISNKMQGATSAYAVNALLDTNLTSTTPDIRIAASSAAFANNLDVGMAGSAGNAAGTVTLVINLMSGTTTAYLRDSTTGSAVHPAGAVAVLANAWMGTSGISAGIAASDSVGVAGSAIANTFSANTSAYAMGGSVNASTLAIKAGTQDGYNGIVGSYGIGGTAGLGAGVIVATMNNQTSAYLGTTADGILVTLSGATGIANALTVNATTTTRTQSYDFGIALGGTGGVAAMATVNLLTNQTLAKIENASVTVLAASPAAQSGVDVSGNETASINATTGGVAAGGSAAGGAAVNVAILKSSNQALINQSTVRTPGSVGVSATSARDLNTTTLTGAISGSAALAGTVGVVLVGDAASADQLSVIGASVGSADTATRSGGGLNTALGAGADGISAAITGGTVTANAVTIAATGNVAVQNLVGAAALSGTGAFGAAVGYTTISQAIKAQASGGTIATQTLSINASAGDDGEHAAHTVAIAGAGGGYVGLGAAVAISEVSNTVDALINSTVSGGTTTVNGVTGTALANTVTVSAGDTSTSLSDAKGFSVSIYAAIGASVAKADRSSIVNAQAQANANLIAQTITIQASEGGATYAYGMGGAGGAGAAGIGVSARATDTAQVTASVLANSRIVATSGLTVSATASPDAKAFAFGASAGSSAVGLSEADAEANSTVTAYVDGNANLLQTAGLAIKALVNVTGTSATAFPSSATLPTSTADFLAGQTTAAAWSIAGSGALSFALNSTTADAKSATTVIAETRDGFRLPSGAVSISASNTTNQYARGIGVAISGGLAVGVVDAEATSTSTTTARVGQNTLSTAQVLDASGNITVPGTATVSIAATGMDTNNADSTAGAGGMYAGNGSVAGTTDSSTVTASVGNNSIISGTSISISAAHSDIFGQMADSLNAGLVGASAALSRHDGTSTVGVDIGTTVALNASAAGLANVCIAYGCTAAVNITATNTFTDTKSGTRAGAGGGINGAGATSTININRNGGGTSITIGDGDDITSGTDATLAPGSIAMVASSVINILDEDNLTTGGLIQGAGVNSTVNGTLTNEIDIGNGVALATRGSINLATYTSGSVSATGNVTTWGVAAVGSANAHIDLTNNERIRISSSASNPTTLAAFYNVNVTAGKDLMHGLSNALTGNAIAQGYVRGLIAVPTAEATTSITTNASVNLGAGSGVYAGQNVNVAANRGGAVVQADGTGHGYELAFIPVTAGHDSASAPTTSTVNLGGTIVAGQYHTLQLTINADGTVSENASGAPVNYTYSATNSTSCSAAITGSCLLTAAQYQTLLNHGNISSGNIAAVRFGALFASGGNTDIMADTLTGGGSIYAYGNPSITVNNANPIAVVLVGGAYIPNVPAGLITFSGNATGAAANAAGITRHADGSSAAGSITIALTNTSGDRGTGAPLIVNAPITNLGGVVSITNSNGSLIYQTIYATDNAGNAILDSSGQKKVVSIGGTQGNQVLVSVPYGALIVDANSPDGSFIAGASPVTEWAGSAIYPGGVHGTNPNDAIMYVASSIYVNQLQAVNNIQNNGGGDINTSLYGTALDGPVNGNNAANGHSALILFGACSYNGLLACPAGATISVYHTTQVAYVQQALTHTITNPDLQSVAGSAQSQQIYGNLIEVHAATIDINGAIYAGPPTVYNITLNAAMGAFVAQLKQYRQSLATGDIWTAYAISEQLSSQYGVSAAFSLLNTAYLGGTLDVTSYIDFGASSARDVKATYDFATGRVSLDKIEAHSTGASIVLDGAIISSNTLGNIHINSGFGQVSINNLTGIDLSVDGINTGSAANASAATSTVMIVDRLKDRVNGTSANDTETFIYNPGTGVKTYISSDGANPVDGNGNVVGGAWLLSSSSGTTGIYSPVTGASYQYVQEAQLKRYFTTTIKDNATVFATASDWVFVSGTPGSPYYYVSPDSVPSTSSGWVSSSGISLTPVGKVIVDPNAPLYSETIYGNIISHGYQAADSNGNPAQCWEGYPCAAPYNVAQWYPDWAFVRVTSVARADNNIGISFSGSASGSVTINSNASVMVSGDIKNATGLTTVTTSPSASSIQSVASASVSGASVNLASGGSIGTSANPVNVTVTTGLGTTTGSFSATARNGGVVANLNSGANGINVSATNGLVQLTAAGNLVATSGSSISGTNVTLKSTNGSIGATNQLLTVQTARGGVLNVAAYGDIGLYIPTGDLLIGQIASSAGNVAIAVANGNIYDSLSQTSASALSQDQIAAIATALHLIGTSDADAGAAAISSFEKTVNADLATYLQFIANGAIAAGTIGSLDSASLTLYAPFANSAAIAAARTGQSGATRFTSPTNAEILATANTLASANGVFTLALTNANRAQYQALAAAALGISGALVSSVTDTQIQAWANARYQAYATTFADAYGAGWQTTVPATTTSFTVTAGSALATKLTMSSNWTAAQLVQAVDVSAMQPSSTTVGSSATPDIVGHDVKLVTQSGSIGTYNPSGMQISLAQMINGTLSSQEQAALATATTPGSVSLIGTDASGHALAAGTSLTTLGAGSTVTGLNIAQTAPVFVSASGAFTISSASSVYLQATAGSSININQLTAQGDVDLKAPGNIAASLVAGQPSSSTQIIASGNLVLVAGSGNIGSSAVPLTLQLGGALINASAGGNVNIGFASGDASLQRVFAGGTATVSTSQGYSIYSGLSGINISAGDIVLNSGKNIGSVNTALAVSATGRLSGSASGIANISAPTVNSAQPNSLTVSSLIASGNIWLSAGNALAITDTVSSTSGNIDTASASLLMNAGSILKAFGTVTVNTIADATLAAIESLLNAATPTNAISISAGGTLYSASSGLSIATGTNGTASLAATLGIGSATSALRLDTASLFSAEATGTNAGLYVTSSGALNASNLQSTGALKLVADALSLGSATSGGDATYLATGNLDFTLLKSTGGKISATSTAGSVSGTTITAYGNAGISAYGDSIGTGIASTTGKIVATSNSGRIDWTSLSAATTIDLTASGSTLTVGSATSGGTQTLHSKDNLTYTSLKTTGIAGDAGDIALTSDTGAIGVTGTDTLDANGGFSLNAATTVSASSLKAAHGAGQVQAGGAIDVGSITTATTLGIASTGSALTIGSVTSGGDGNYAASGNIAFGDLYSTTGHVVATSARGAINGNHLSAPGDVTLDAATSVAIATIDPANVSIAAANSVSIGQLIASGIVDLGSSVINVSNLLQDPNAAGSFNVNIGGYRGAVGQSASLHIVTPNLLNIGSMNEGIASISTTGANVVIGSGRIMQSLLLTTAQQSIYMTAFFASPQNGYGVQSYLPTGSFYLQQYGLETTTNSLVVQFASGAKIRQDINGRIILGFSLAGNVSQLIGSVGPVTDSTGSTSAPTWDSLPGVYSVSGDGTLNGSGYVPAVNWTTRQPLTLGFSGGIPTLQ